MATITSINATQVGSFLAAPTVLSASDIITFDLSRKQLLVLKNPTAGSLTVTIDGDDATAVNVPGIGSVSVAAGLPVVLAAGQTKAIVLATAAEYCKGIVRLVGGALVEATLFNL